MRWRYEWVATLPREVYSVLIQLLNDDARRADDAREELD